MNLIKSVYEAPEQWWLLLLTEETPRVWVGVGEGFGGSVVKDCLEKKKELDEN